MIGDPLDGRFFIWPEDGDEAEARAYSLAASPQRAAECRAGEDWLAGEKRWPRRYRVRCAVTGSIWSVEVTVAMQPSFVTKRSHEVSMEPSTHILWGGDVLCKDRRLSGVPSDWPDGQRWISLQAVADGAVAPDDGCAKCWSAAPALVLGIQQIGDFYPVENQK